MGMTQVALSTSLPCCQLLRVCVIQIFFLVSQAARDRLLLQKAATDLTSRWAVVGAGCFVVVILLIGIVLVFTTGCCSSKDNRVKPVDDSRANTDGGDRPPAKPPVPPWDRGEAPPGIVMASAPPANFQPYVSNPRLPGDPPYERLVLVSSRVADVMRVVRAAELRANVAVVAYDWSTWTLQELLGHVRRVLAGGKVTSLAVVAPGKNAGGVGLLEGYQTTVDKLGGKAELAQFWRALASCVAASSGGDGGRVDLIASRINEVPAEGAVLLMALWKLTSVPFAASDNAQGGYRLSTFQHNPATNEVTLALTNVQSVDIYFDRASLLGMKSAVPPPPAHVPPLPAGMPPASAVSPNPYAAIEDSPQHSAPPPVGTTGAQPPRPAGQLAPLVQSALPQQVGGNQQAAPGAIPAYGVQSAAMPAQQGQAIGPVASAPQPVGVDIFTKFYLAVKQAGISVEELFRRYDKDGSGILAQEEVLDMLKWALPAVSELDSRHFKAMLDTDGSSTVTIEELRSALVSSADVHAAVRSLQDQSQVMLRLYEYLAENEQIMRQIFDQYDTNQNGSLEHNELQQLVAMIPGLKPEEVKYVCAYLYQSDPNKDGCLTFDELKALTKQFVIRLQAKRKAQGDADIASHAPTPAPPTTPQSPAPPGFNPSVPGTAGSTAPPTAQATPTTLSPAPSGMPPPLAAPGSQPLTPAGSGVPLGPPRGHLAPLAPLGNVGSSVPPLPLGVLGGPALAGPSSSTPLQPLGGGMAQSPAPGGTLAPLVKAGGGAPLGPPSSFPGSAPSQLSPLVGSGQALLQPAASGISGQLSGTGYLAPLAAPLAPLVKAGSGPPLGAATPSEGSASSSLAPAFAPGQAPLLSAASGMSQASAAGSLPASSVVPGQAPLQSAASGMSQASAAGSLAASALAPGQAPLQSAASGMSQASAAGPLQSAASGMSQASGAGSLAASALAPGQAPLQSAASGMSQASGAGPLQSAASGMSQASGAGPLQSAASGMSQASGAGSLAASALAPGEAPLQSAASGMSQASGAGPLQSAASGMSQASGAGPLQSAASGMSQASGAGSLAASALAPGEAPLQSAASGMSQASGAGPLQSAASGMSQASGAGPLQSAASGMSQASGAGPLQSAVSNMSQASAAAGPLQPTVSGMSQASAAGSLTSQAPPPKTSNNAEPAPSLASAGSATSTLSAVQTPSGPTLQPLPYPTVQLGGQPAQGGAPSAPPQAAGTAATPAAAAMEQPLQPRAADGFSGAPAVGAVEMLTVPTPARRGMLSPVGTLGK